MKKSFILALFLVMAIGIGTVSAETLTGTLGSTTLDSRNYARVAAGGTGSGGEAYIINIAHIEYSTGLYSWVYFNNQSKFTFDAGAPGGAYAPVTFKLWGSPYTVIGHGTVGYQRFFNGDTPPVEQNGAFFYFTVDDWNVSGLSGDTYITLDYNHTLLSHISMGTCYVGNDPGTPGNILLLATAGISSSAAGPYTVNYESNAFAEYTATKPSGLKISGWVNKSSGGETYSVQGFILDTDGEVISSEDLLGPDPFYFTVPDEQIIIGIKGSSGLWYNSSTLFSPGIGTGTPTPTPTSNEDQPPAAGYVRTYAHVKDRGGNLIHGANINIKDTFGNTWRNSSSDADGISFIDTLPNAYINIYADFTVFENEFLPGSLLTQAVGSGGNTYYLILYPWESGASEGNVSLYVEVKDVDGSFIPYANVQIVLSNGYSYAGSTANLGSKVFLVPNNTVVRATGSASGYLPATVIGNSGTGGSMTMTINLHKQVITVQPTATVPPGGVTPAQTVDPNDPVLHGGDTSFKAQEMMNFLAMNGMDLVQLCFMVTILALLGFKFGK